MWKGVGENIFLMKLPRCSSFFIYLQHEEISGISSQRVFDYKKVNW